MPAHDPETGEFTDTQQSSMGGGDDAEAMAGDEPVADEGRSAAPLSDEIPSPETADDPTTEDDGMIADGATAKPSDGNQEESHEVENAPDEMDSGQSEAVSVPSEDSTVATNGAAGREPTRPVAPLEMPDIPAFMDRRIKKPEWMEEE